MSRLTLEQGRSGTLIYMSPQQLNGERCTHLDDIYSLGATIYELLTSKPPFYSGNIDRQICERTAPSMTERRKELDIEPALVPQVWEDAVAACLAKERSAASAIGGRGCATHAICLRSIHDNRTDCTGQETNQESTAYR